MGVVVEGVETEQQRVLLRLAGCNEMQGYLFSKPTTREGIERLLRGQMTDVRAQMTDVRVQMSEVREKA